VQIAASAAEPQAAASLDALYRAHVGAARRLAVLLTGDAALAEDVAHDAFLRVAAKRDTLRDPGAFEIYLKRAVVNSVRSLARHQQVVRKHEHRFELRETPDDGPDLPLRDALWDAMQSLPERQRIALVLRYYEGASERDIAETMHCAPGTVKSLVSRGLARLREVIEDV
jgi:RNA polymerase sigma-70 factor (sigma-E family)